MSSKYSVVGLPQLDRGRSYSNMQEVVPRLPASGPMLSLRSLLATKTKMDTHANAMEIQTRSNEQMTGNGVSSVALNRVALYERTITQEEADAWLGVMNDPTARPTSEPQAVPPAKPSTAFKVRH